MTQSVTPIMAGGTGRSGTTVIAGCYGIRIKPGVQLGEQPLALSLVHAQVQPAGTPESVRAQPPRAPHSLLEGGQSRAGGPHSAPQALATGDPEDEVEE